MGAKGPLSFLSGAFKLSTSNLLCQRAPCRWVLAAWSSILNAPEHHHFLGCKGVLEKIFVLTVAVLLLSATNNLSRPVDVVGLGITVPTWNYPLPSRLEGEFQSPKVWIRMCRCELDIWFWNAEFRERVEIDTEFWREGKLALGAPSFCLLLEAS